MLMIGKDTWPKKTGLTSVPLLGTHKESHYIISANAAPIFVKPNLQAVSLTTYKIIQQS